MRLPNRRLLRWSVRGLGFGTPARHLNQNGTQHEYLSASSASARASARSQITCLIRPKPLVEQSLQPSHPASTSHCAALSRLQADGSYPTQSVADHPPTAQTDSKYIAFHNGGFLQVAVSEAPHLRACRCPRLRGGALQIQH